MLACDATITRIITDLTGLPLDVGRTHRTATRAQRRALRALYTAPKSGYRLYPFTLAELNSLGKHLDKARGQDNPVNRESILEILTEGFENVQFTDKELILSRPGDFLRAELTPEHALRDLALAARLMQRL